MSDMSTGQIVGGIAGGVAGFFIGGPAGAAIGFGVGAGIGGYIDPPKTPNFGGPSLDDKSFQSSAYGVSIPRLYGTIATMGNVIYLENNEYKAVSKKESQGGKGGGGGGTYETTTYFATFAIALCSEMAGSSPRRIWAGGKLIYSTVSTDVESILAVSSSSVTWRYYDGTQDEPDSRMEASLGVGNCPSYNGTAYIIFYDFDLTDYGNGLTGCPIKVELSQKTDDVDLIGNEHNIVFLDEEGWPGVLGPTVMTIAPLVDGSLHAFAHFPSYDLSGDFPVFTGNVLIQTTKSLNINAKQNQLRRTFTTETTFIQPGGDDYIDGGVCRNLKYAINAYDGDYDTKRYFCITSSATFYAPEAWRFYIDTQIFFTRQFKRVYQRGSHVLFLCRRNNFETELSGDQYPKLSWFFYCPTIPDAYSHFRPEYLGIDTNTHCIAMGFETFAVIEPNDFSPIVRIYYITANGFELIREFTVSLSVSVSMFVPALLDNGTIYIANYYPSEASGIIRLIKINIDTAAVEEYSMQAPNHYLSMSAASISLDGGLVVLACRKTLSGTLPPTYVMVYYTIRIGGGANGSYAALSEIVTNECGRCDIGPSDIDVSDLDGIEVRGYRVSDAGSGRGALSPLQGAFLFDFIERGYSLAAVRRGSTSNELVPWNHLVSEQGDSVMHRESEAESKLPSRYYVSYIDYNREYDTNEEYADYPSSMANEISRQIPVVLNPDEAARLADVFINLSWIEKTKFSFSLPQIYLDWLPGDIKTIEYVPGKTIDVRVESIDYKLNQIISVNARAASAAAYQSTATGSYVTPPDDFIPYAGPSSMALVDVPMIIPEMDKFGFLAGIWGLYSWQGAVLMRSSDVGQTYNAVAQSAVLPTVGYAINAINISDPYIVDRKSVLIISPVVGEFESVTEAQMMQGKNYCAYGADGRWELIRFADAVPQVDDTILISTFARGLRGTEWAMGAHTQGDQLVLLSETELQFVGTDVEAYMVARQYKAVTIGANVQDAEAQQFTYQAANLRPLSGVLPHFAKAGNDWVVTWFGRARYPSSWWTTGVQPQNEPVIKYEVDIIVNDVVVRTINALNSSVTYTEEQQIVDTGALLGALRMRIYQISDRVGRGYPLEVLS